MQAHIVVHATCTRFAASEAEARQTRQMLVDTYGHKKKSISIEPIEIPTTKTELLEFLNHREAAHEKAS